MSSGISIVGFSKNRAVADFYPTPDYATTELLKREQFDGLKRNGSVVGVKNTPKEIVGKTRYNI